MNKDYALKLAKELDGVIADVEEGDGFDDVCLGTILYVRDALVDHIRDATKMVEQPDYRAVKTWHEGKPVYVAEPPCKTGSQCTSKCQQCEQPAPVAEPHKQQEPVRLQCTTCGTVYADGVPPQAQQQEPFGYFRYDLRLDAWVQNREGRPGTPFYTSPQPSKPWVGLTEEDIGDACGFAEHTTASTRFALKAISRAIEAKLREKNA